MADTIDITAGAGTKVSTEEVTTLNGGAVSAQHVQRVVPAARTADGAAVDLGTPHDAAAAAVPPLLVGGYASTAAPADVSADADAVRLWCLRNGAQMVSLYGGTGFISDTNGVYCQGSTQHDGVDAGFPVKIGFYALAHGTTPTAVAEADRVNGVANRLGVQYVIGGSPNVVTTRLNFTGAQTDQQVGPTVGATQRLVVTQVQVTADNANTAFPAVRLGFGATNTPTTTGVVASHPGVPAGGGFSRGDGSGVLGAGADGEELRLTAAAPTGGSIDVVVTHYLVG